MGFSLVETIWSYLKHTAFGAYRQCFIASQQRALAQLHCAKSKTCRVGFHRFDHLSSESLM